MAKEQRKTRKNKSYTLVAYSNEWPRQFLEIKELLSSLYGSNLIAIHHIGSTSIPGMLTKPQIDVCAVVKKLNEVTGIRSEFTALGFSAKGDYVGQQEEYFTLDENGERKCNVHTLQQENPAIEGYLSFRDYLRAHENARNEYISIKKELRSTFGEDDYNSYDWGKDEKIADLKKRALQWYRQHPS